MRYVILALIERIINLMNLDSNTKLNQNVFENKEHVREDSVEKDINHINEHDLQLEVSPTKNTKKSLIIDFNEKSIRSSIVSSGNEEDYLPIKDFDYNENFMCLEGRFSKKEKAISK